MPFLGASFLSFPAHIRKMCIRDSISAVDVLLQADKAYCSLTQKAAFGAQHNSCLLYTSDVYKRQGFGFHHASEDGKYLSMGNGTQAFAIAAEQPERDNPLKHVE